MLTLTDIAVRFGGQTLYVDLNWQVNPRGHYGLVGSNGSGKSTLLRVMTGELAPSEGSVSLPPREPGWVPQQPALYSKLSVAENLRLFARLEKVPDVERTVAEMLDQTALGERARDEVGKLSGGNRQRVNIAIGLIGDPVVLLLDEPSASLDPRQRDRLWQFLSALGTTVVFSTHDVGEAERYADRLLVLADGELLFIGTPAELETATGATAAAPDFETAFVRFLHERGH